MRRQGINLRRFTVVTVIFCLGIFAACENSTGGDTKPEPEKPTENTFVKFTNREQFKVTVYSDPGRQKVFAKVSGKGSTTVNTEPNQIGTPYYLTYHVILEGVEIPYDSPGAIIVRVDENKINIVNINQLFSISSASAYIKIQNNGIDTLVLRNNNSEMLPIGAVSTIIVAGEAGAYQISPGPVSVFSFMKNTTIPVSFPVSLVKFEAGYLYSFVFNGSSLVLDIVPVDVTIARMGTLRTLAEMLAWLDNNAENGGIYTLYIRTDDEIDPATLSYNSKDVTIILRTIYEGNELKINLKGNGSLFYVGNNVKLILNAGIVLQGRTGNYNALIRVNDGGTFTMNGGKITGNSSSSSSSSYGDDSNSYGGGVYVGNGTFIMDNGEISENSSSSSSSSGGRSHSYGGGVYVDSGTFTMNGGKVSGNTAYAYGRHYAYANGGGVYVSGGTFTMNGGKISGNTATSKALETVGQYVYSPHSYGGGVCVVNGGIFNMNDGEISGNTTPSSGPSFYSGDSYGGGIFVSGIFRISGGVIYGDDAATELRNTAASQGAALAGDGQYGTFSGNNFYSSSNLTTTDTTIRIVNGSLQEN